MMRWREGLQRKKEVCMKDEGIGLGMILCIFYISIDCYLLIFFVWIQGSWLMINKEGCYLLRLICLILLIFIYFFLIFITINFLYYFFSNNLFTHSIFFILHHLFLFFSSSPFRFNPLISFLFIFLSLFVTIYSFSHLNAFTLTI